MKLSISSGIHNLYSLALSKVVSEASCIAGGAGSLADSHTDTVVVVISGARAGNGGAEVCEGTCAVVYMGIGTGMGTNIGISGGNGMKENPRGGTGAKITCCGMYMVLI